MSLFSALTSSANALATFERAMTVTQNNVSNSSTPGYAKQTPTFEALPFFDGSSQSGGVTSGPVEDSRSQFAETNVQSISSQAGEAQQQVQSLTALQNTFDISGTTGVPAALSSLFSAFSNWNTATNSASGQQQVLTSAQSVASSFQQAASQVQQAASSANASVSSVLNQVNALAAQLSGYNAQILAGQSNSGLSAAIYNTLQQLSQLVNISTLNESNGTVTVMLGGGQSALVSGPNADTLSISVYVPQPPPLVNPSGPPTAHVVNSQGKDITPQITGGSLGGLLTFRNQTLAAIQGDGTQTGSLNVLAQSFADRINSLVPGTVAQGTGVTATVASIVGDATNQASQAVPGQTQFALSGPGFSDANAVTLSVNSSGLTDLPSLAKEINSAIQSAASGTSAPAVALQQANVVASVMTDKNGNAALSFSSLGATAFQVTGGDKTANALMGNFNPASADPLEGQPTGAYNAGGVQTAAALTFTPFTVAGNSQTVSLNYTGTDGKQVATTPLTLNSANAGTTAQAISSLNAQLQSSSDPVLRKLVAVAQPGAAQTTITLMGSQGFQLSWGAPVVPGMGFGVGTPNTSVSSVATPSPAGSALYQYDTKNRTNIASSLNVNSGFTASQLASDGGTGTNAISLVLSNLGNSNHAADQVSGQTFTQYFGSIAAGVGSQLSTAQLNQTTAQNQLTQSEQLRQQVSGVDLNQEAAQILQFQQAYTAASKVITAIDTMTQTVLALITPSNP